MTLTWRTKAWLSLIALTLIVVRTGEAHLHMCFDGQSATSAFHAADTGPLCDSADEGDGAHQDKDVATLGDALAKSSSDFHLLALLPALELIWVLPPERVTGALLPLTPVPVPQHPPSFRPPLRGPPA